MTRRSVVLLACALAIAAPAPAHAQFSKLKDKIKKTVEDKANGTTSSKPSAPASAPAASTPAASSESTTNAAPSHEKAATLKPGEGAWANYDFVPGDKILFAEDFSVDRVGNFPRRLELEKGTMEVVSWDNRRWLRNTSDAEFTIVLPKALPERWTMEFEAAVPWQGMWVYPGEQTDQNYNEVQSIFLGLSPEIVVPGKKSSELNLQTLFGEDVFPGFSTDAEDSYTSVPLHVRVQADGAYMKVYIEDKRIGNIPNMGRWMGNKLHFFVRENTVNSKQFPAMITNISINEGGKEMYDKLMANGRLAVQGIYFDVGSDRIRPESSGTLTEISEMLKEHADLKLTVEGHTDNVGAPEKNRTLSDARAAAVVKYLAEKGIDAARLKSVGLGDTKPAAPNDSPENRQKNRRVELVKM